MTNQRLTDSIAVDIIIHHFSGRTNILLEDIRRRVEDAHEASGGLPLQFTPPERHPASKALYALKRLGFADNPLRGHWNIKSVDDMCARLHTLVHGDKGEDF